MADQDQGTVSAHINITPLADVMLVLLIIFMITAPLSTPQIKVTLPQAVLKKKANIQKVVAPINLAIKKDGSLFWDGSPVSKAELRAKLTVAAQKVPQPPLKIRAAQNVRYQVIKQVLKIAKGTGMVHMGFVTRAPGKSS